jgi:cytochrome c556
LPRRHQPSSPKPEDAIKYRQSSLFVMAQHFGRIGAMANGRVPFDAKVAADNALTVVANMAKLPWAGFGAGTDKGAAHQGQGPRSGPSRPSSRKLPTS